MNDIEMDAPSFSGEGSNHDFCGSALSPFSGSDNESHQLLCAIVVAMSEELKEGNLPSSPDAYFGVACSFLDRIASEPNPQSHVLDPLLTVFSLPVPGVPMAVLKDQSEFFSELIVRTLRSHRRRTPLSLDADGVIQKKAYKALSIVLKDNLEVMKQENAGCFLSEIILAVKEDHKKTRNQAYDILVEIGHAVGDEETGGNREKLHQFFIKIARGLRATFPYFVSAVVKSLAHLASNFADLVLPAFNCLRRMYLLCPTENREIIKANLGWLEAELLLGMLVTECGLGAVEAVMPEEHMNLLYQHTQDLLNSILLHTHTHRYIYICIFHRSVSGIFNPLEQIQEWKERKRGAKSGETRSHFSKSTSRSNMRLKKNLAEHLVRR